MTAARQPATEADRVRTLEQINADGRALLEPLLGPTFPISDRLAAWAGELATKARLQHAGGAPLDQVIADLAFSAALTATVRSTRLLDEQPNLLSLGGPATEAATYGRGRVTVQSALLSTLERLARDVIRNAVRSREDAEPRLAAVRLIDRARDAIDTADDAHAARTADAAAVAAALREAAQALTDAAGLIAPR